MMKKTFAIILSFCSIIFFGQKIKVLDSETQKPIAYAKLIFKNQTYKNTEENGETFLEDKNELSEIQSFGYENLSIEKYQNVYLLKPVYTDINSVEISKPKFQYTLKTGEIIDENSSFGGFAATWTVANYFPFEEKFRRTRFIKFVHFAYDLKKKKNAKIKLVFYRSEYGKPSDKIWKSYIVECSSKKNIAEFELENPVPFPEEGVFVGFEWINSKENTIKQKFYYSKSEPGLFDIRDFFSLSIESHKTNHPEIWVLGKIVWQNEELRRTKSGQYHQEGWLKYEDFVEKPHTNIDLNRRLSIQLELTN